VCGHGRGQGGFPLGFKNLTFSNCIVSTKGCFLGFERKKNEISPFLAPPEKIFLAASGKIHYCPPRKNSSDTHVCG